MRSSDGGFGLVQTTRRGFITGVSLMGISFALAGCGGGGDDEIDVRETEDDGSSAASATVEPTYELPEVAVFGEGIGFVDWTSLEKGDLASVSTEFVDFDHRWSFGAPGDVESSRDVMTSHAKSGEAFVYVTRRSAWSGEYARGESIEASDGTTEAPATEAPATATPAAPATEAPAASATEATKPEGAKPVEEIEAPAPDAAAAPADAGSEQAPAPAATSLLGALLASKAFASDEAAPADAAAGEGAAPATTDPAATDAPAAADTAATDATGAKAADTAATGATGAKAVDSAATDTKAADSAATEGGTTSGGTTASGAKDGPSRTGGSLDASSGPVPYEYSDREMRDMVIEVATSTIASAIGVEAGGEAVVDDWWEDKAGDGSDAWCALGSSHDHRPLGGSGDEFDVGFGVACVHKGCDVLIALVADGTPNHDADANRLEKWVVALLDTFGVTDTLYTSSRDRSRGDDDDEASSGDSRTSAAASSSRRGSISGKGTSSSDSSDDGSSEDSSEDSSGSSNEDSGRRNSR